MMPGAEDSIKRLSVVLISPLPSIGRAKESTTLPIVASPTGI